MDEYTLLKKYLHSLCLAGVFTIKFTVSKTIFFEKFINYIVIHIVLPKWFLKLQKFTKQFIVRLPQTGYFTSELTRRPLKNPGSNRGSTRGYPRVSRVWLGGLVAKWLVARWLGAEVWVPTTSHQPPATATNRFGGYPLGGWTRSGQPPTGGQRPSHQPPRKKVVDWGVFTNPAGGFNSGIWKSPGRGFPNPRAGDLWVKIPRFGLGIFVHKSPRGFPFTNPLKSAISGLEKNITKNHARQNNLMHVKKNGKISRQKH